MHFTKAVSILVTSKFSLLVIDCVVSIAPAIQAAVDIVYYADDSGLIGTDKIEFESA